MRERGDGEELRQKGNIHPQQSLLTDQKIKKFIGWLRVCVVGVGAHCELVGRSKCDHEDSCGEQVCKLKCGRRSGVGKGKHCVANRQDMRDWDVATIGERVKVRGKKEVFLLFICFFLVLLGGIIDEKVY